MGDRQPVSKAEEFAAITRDFVTLAQNAHLYKDEAIQAGGERYMEFVIENADLIARALRRDAAIEKTGDFLIPLDKAVGAEIARREGQLHPRHYVDFVLAAFREAVR